jgi:HK97 family phage major capsid protein
MKTARMIELQRQRHELIDEARSVTEEIKTATGDKLDGLGKRHDDIMRSIDLNRLDIDEEAMSNAEDEARAKQRPNLGGGEAFGVDDGLSAFAFPSGWTDQRGNPVRVLDRNERFATERSRGMSFGDHVRALAVGPRNDAEKRALSEGTASEGGYTVPAPLAAEFIDRLRAQTVAIRAGARTVPMTSQSLAIARLDTDPSVTWRLENSLIDDSDPVFSRILLEAKAVAGIVKVSRELLADTVNASEMLTNAFAQAMALELDRVALWNDGADDGPIGVAATSGINEVSMGTNGAALANYDKLIDAVYEMQLDNANDPTAAIMHPRTQAALAKLKDGQNNPLTVPDMIARIPRLTTTSASIAETQGSATTASSILFGDYRHLFIGMRDEVQITVLRERYADYGQVGFLCWMRADVQLAHKASFSRLKGIIPA